MRDRILSINPEAQVTIRQEFFLPEKKGEYNHE
jgi:tRNA A37 threonylcarbamoyladenosine dehydratase